VTPDALTPDNLVLGLTWFVVFIFSTTLHEAGHAFAAYKLGDPTAYEGGQVSLNPIPHIRREPVGMVLVPLISFALNGWMMGWASAPYNPDWAHRYPKRAALMAAAGPAANLLLVLVSGLAIRAGIAAGVFDSPDVANFTTVTVATGPGLAAAAAKPLSILFSLNLLLSASRSGSPECPCPCGSCSPSTWSSSSSTSCRCRRSTAAPSCPAL